MSHASKKRSPGQGFITIVAGGALLAAAYFAGFHLNGMATVDSQPTSTAVNAPVAKSAVGPTTTTTLPSQTNSAWSLPPFTLPGLDGASHTLSDWKGRVIMLNFWATWCPPCQYEIPSFIEFQQKYEEKGLQIVGIGVDQQKKLANFVRTLEINYPVLIADEITSGQIMEDWGNKEQILPYTVIIDKEGRIHYIHRGQFSDAEFAEYVLPLLG